MTAEQKEQLDCDLTQVSYAWQEWGDLERHTGWPEIRARLQLTHPEIPQAWDNHKAAQRTLTAVIKFAFNEFDSD